GSARRRVSPSDDAGGDGAYPELGGQGHCERRGPRVRRERGQLRGGRRAELQHAAGSAVGDEEVAPTSNDHRSVCGTSKMKIVDIVKKATDVARPEMSNRSLA